MFEDNGGNGSNRFLTMNNFACDPGEFSDRIAPGSMGSGRGMRRVSSVANEYKVFTEEGGLGRILVMGLTSLDLSTPRTGGPYDVAGYDLTSSSVVPFTGGSEAPFSSGTMALFFSPDGLVYLKDPTYPLGPNDRHYYTLDKTGQSFYVVRVAYDDPATGRPELPNYYEIAINRYGAVTYIRWETVDGGSSWEANVE